jgi:hypothetical protein
MAITDFLSPGFENAFEGFLEYDPQMAYSSFGPSFGRDLRGSRSPAQQRYFEGQFSDIRNRYLGELGRQVRGGELPSTSFEDYLGAFPWADRYAALPPSMKGAYTSQFAPRTAIGF